MKVLSSFRLTNAAKQNLKYLAGKYRLSEADVIEAMCDFFVGKNSLEFEFEVYMGSYKLKQNKLFQKFQAEYEKADAETQKAMRQMYLGNTSMFD